MQVLTPSYILWNINPDIFTIPFLNHPVRWYGLLWAVGLLLSQWMMTFVYKREGRSVKEVDTMTLYIVLGTMIGARLGHVLFYDPIYYSKNPLLIPAIWEGGLASHGGAVGIFISAWFFARKTNVNYAWILDRLCIVGALTGFFIRMGNLMNSEMVGVPTTVPWAFIFTSVDDLPRHPAQLYEAICCLLIFIAAFYVWKNYRGRIRNGIVLGWFLIILFSLRFADEFFKISQVDFEDNMVVNMGQILSIPFILAGIIILLRGRRNKAATEFVLDSGEKEEK